MEKENEKLQTKKEIKEEIIKDIKSTTIIIPEKDIKSKQEVIKNNKIKTEIKEEKENK